METTWINGGVLLAALLAYPTAQLIVREVNARIVRSRMAKRVAILTSRGAL